MQRMLRERLEENMRKIKGGISVGSRATDMRGRVAAGGRYGNTDNVMKCIS